MQRSADVQAGDQADVHKMEAGEANSLWQFMKNSESGASEADILKLEFQKHDRNKGRMSFEELQLLLKDGGGAGMDAVAKQLYECMSKDRDGKISFEDFVDFICSERSKTSQARFCCQTRVALRKETFTPFTFPPPWNELGDADDDGEGDQDDSATRCTFEEFCAWLSYDTSQERKVVPDGEEPGGFETSQNLVSELKSLVGQGDRDGAKDFFMQNSAAIDDGIRPDTGASYLASKATLRELQHHAACASSCGWSGQAPEGLQCGEILQVALVEKLIARKSLRVTPRLVQALHQVVTCGRRLSAWRQEDPARPHIAQLGVLRHTTPPASALPTLVVWYCKQTEVVFSHWNPYDAAAFALWWIYNIQPFSDGNGRVARGLTLAILRLHGYAPSPHAFHQRLREQEVCKRLAASLGTVNTLTGSCKCCQLGEDSPPLGLKAKAFASLSSLLQEFTALQ